MNPAVKRYQKLYQPVADAIAYLDLEQTDREKVATAVADALAGQRDFRRDLFWLTAADPLVDCAGPGDGPCPHARRIRVRMHLRDGRSAAWQPRKPVVRCLPCGARHA